MFLELCHFWCQFHIIIWGGGGKKAPQTLNILFQNFKNETALL